jgi:hypothetical protein
MGGLISLPSFKDQFSNPSPGLLGFMVSSYDVRLLQDIGIQKETDQLRSVVCLVLLFPLALEIALADGIHLL